LPPSGAGGSMAPMSDKRRRSSLQEGHRRKFLVVVDGTPESERALHFAAKRAEHTGGGVTLLSVISPADFQHWLGVGNIMREEAEEEARKVLDYMVNAAQACSGIVPETVIREGSMAEELIKLIEADEDIAILVLGASTEASGPGPLVSMLASGAAGTFPIPVTIVPGDLTDDLIDLLA